MTGGPFAALDARFLPQLARRVQAVVDRLRRRAVALVGPGTLTGEGVRTYPALAGSIAAVSAAALVLAIAGGPGGPPAEPTPSTPPAATLPALPDVITALGPAPGSSVASYLAKAQFDLRHFGEVAGTRSGYAIVDLRSFETPAQVAATFAGVQVARAYVRVPQPHLPTEVRSIVLQGTLAALTPGMSASGRLAGATATTFRLLVRSIKPRSGTDRALQARYEQEEQAASYEAPRLEHPATCACVFAMVVHADVSRLAALVRLPQVRVVDPASPQASLDELTVFPLEPEVTTTVPRVGPFGG